MSITISTGAALAIASGVGAAGSITSSLIGSSAAKTAANEQEQAGQKAIDFEQGIFNQQQQNISPFLSAGQTSIANLMKQIESGTFGAGSTPNFTAPTLAEAQNQPGYQFTQQQGEKGIAEAAAGAGGAISGGTLKAASSFNQGLATTNYQQVFQNAMSGYQANLQNQAQQFNEAFAPAQLGENAAASINNTGTALSQNVGGLIQGIGNSQAAGTVGSANSITSGISGATNGILQSVLLGQLFGGGVSGGNTPPLNGPQIVGAYGIPPVAYGGGPG